MSALYLLDTSTVSYLINRRSEAARDAMEQAQSEHAAIAISAVTQAELLYGVVRKAGKNNLSKAVEEFCDYVLVLPWDSTAARSYGPLRAKMAAAGKILSPIDLLIAAHALATRAILVTGNQAFRQVPDLEGLSDWATDL